MTQTDKLLILDAGYVGRHLYAKFGPAKALITYYSSPIEGGVYFDATAMSLGDVLDEPETFSHAAVLFGETNPDVVSADPDNARALNVDSIKAVLDYLRSWDIKPIFTSSESVFEGTKGSYVETDPACSILTYGRQKVEVESYIQERFDDYIVLRFGKVFGSQRRDGTLFTNWLDNIKNSETIYCAYDQVFSPIYIENVVDGFVKLIEKGCNGLFHMCNHKSYSRLDLFNILLATLEKHSPTEANMVPCSIHDFDLREKRPLNISMKPDKLVAATGLQISDVGEICETIVNNWFDGPVAEIRADRPQDFRETAGRPNFGTR